MRKEFSLRKLTPFHTQYQNFFHRRLSFFSGKFPRLFLPVAMRFKRLAFARPHAQVGFGSLNRETRFRLVQRRCVEVLYLINLTVVAALVVSHRK